jgi:hypothetical protein
MGKIIAAGGALSQSIYRKGCEERKGKPLAASVGKRNIVYGLEA